MSAENVPRWRNACVSPEQPPSVCEVTVVRVGLSSSKPGTDAPSLHGKGNVGSLIVEHLVGTNLL